MHSLQTKMYNVCVKKMLMCNRERLRMFAADSTNCTVKLQNVSNTIQKIQLSY